MPSEFFLRILTLEFLKIIPNFAAVYKFQFNSKPNLDPRTFFLLFEFMTTLLFSQRCHFIKKHERALGTRMRKTFFFPNQSNHSLSAIS